MPLAVKDIDNARLALASLRRHVLHPVENIVVAGQDHQDIRDFCADESIRYINENDVLPDRVKNLSYTLRGVNMNGWIRQQVLKLTAFHYLSATHILVYDSDTMLVRDISFFEGNKQIFFLSDEYNKNYHAMTQRLIGPIVRHPRSFVSHFMMLQRDLVVALENQIEHHMGMGMVEAILARLDRSVYSSLSEFELYGNYVHTFAPERMTTRYWYNVKIKAGNGLTLEQVRAENSRFNSVSAHIH